MGKSLSTSESKRAHTLSDTIPLNVFQHLEDNSLSFRVAGGCDTASPSKLILRRNVPEPCLSDREQQSQEESHVLEIVKEVKERKDDHTNEVIARPSFGQFTLEIDPSLEDEEKFFLPQLSESEWQKLSSSLMKSQNIEKTLKKEQKETKDKEIKEKKGFSRSPSNVETITKSAVIIYIFISSITILFFLFLFLILRNYSGQRFL